MQEYQDKLREMQGKVEAAQADLQQFAYIVSHDLQEPLRMVSSYCQLLAHRYGDALDDDAREFIAFAVDGAQRMKTLITDLLHYSRVSSRGKEFELIDLQKPLEAALAKLQPEIKESMAVITHDVMPSLEVDVGQFVQLFQHLIGNALKFRNSKSPSIHITAAKREEKWEFQVVDNGIGIDPQFIDKIFGVFQRFNGDRDYSGNGIGLAICKRIIDRHGGQIWVESESGSGSTFFFTIPERCARISN